MFHTPWQHRANVYAPSQHAAFPVRAGFGGAGGICKVAMASTCCVWDGGYLCRDAPHTTPPPPHQILIHPLPQPLLHFEAHARTLLLACTQHMTEFDERTGSVGAGAQLVAPVYAPTRPAGQLWHSAAPV